MRSPWWCCTALRPRAGLPLVVAVLAWIASAVPALPAQRLAQVSPLCERNGRPDYCAYTPEEDGSAPERETAWIVFADQMRVRLVRDEANCRAQGAFRLCQAWMTLTSAAGEPLPAQYRGRCIPGGYRHEYRSRVLQLAFVVLSPTAG